MEEHAVVDRIVDGKQAVLLVGKHEHEVVVPATMLPTGAGEGSHVVAHLEVTGVTLDTGGTGEAKARIDDKLDQLRARGSRLTPDE